MNTIPSMAAQGAAFVHVKVQNMFPDADPTPGPTVNYQGGDVNDSIRNFGDNIVATSLYIIAGLSLIAGLGLLLVTYVWGKKKLGAGIACLIVSVIAVGPNTWMVWLAGATQSFRS